MIAMLDIKTILGTVAVLMVFIGYVPYLRDCIKGKTKPHMFSWLVGMIISFIAFGLQIQDKAGPGAFVTLSAAIISAVILLFAIKNKDKDITQSDFIALLLSIGALIFWLVAKDPVVSTVFVIFAEALSFLPTVRKSWNAPYSETLSSYVINFIRFSIAIIALQNYSFVSVGYPATWLVLNGLFALILINRRAVIKLK